LEPIAKDVETGAVSSVRVFFISYESLASVSVGPEHLMQNPLTTNNITTEMRESLGRALRDTRGALAKNPPDLRWGVHLVTKDNAVLHTIYLNRSGRGAILDGNVAKINWPLIRWFEKNFYARAKRNAAASPVISGDQFATYLIKFMEQLRNKDLVFHVREFYRVKQRWPADATELKSFVGTKFDLIAPHESVEILQNAAGDCVMNYSNKERGYEAKITVSRPDD
jgi:hypothetical protein